MSYNLCFWSSQVPVLPGDAEHIYLQLCHSNKVLEPGVNAEKNIQHFRETLISRYPEISSFSDDDVDDCVWSCDFDASDIHIIVSMSYSRTSEAVPYALQIALKNELVAYDPQKNIVFNPQFTSETH